MKIVRKALLNYCCLKFHVFGEKKCQISFGSFLLIFLFMIPLLLRSPFPFLLPVCISKDVAQVSLNVIADHQVGADAGHADGGCLKRNNLTY
jgi:hypothetical protein